jgi:hypothetical protein
MKTHHIFMICFAWVFGTFALHCWLLYALTGVPDYSIVSADSRGRTAALNRSISSPENASDPAKQAAERAALEMHDNKLFYALSAQEAAELQVLALAGNADVASRRAATRAWISWGIVAFTPVMVFTYVSRRAKLMSRVPQPDGPGHSHGAGQ